MKQLEEYREQALSDIVSNQAIKDYLLNTVNSTVDGETLIMKNVFPYWKVPDVKTTAGNYIAMSVTVPNVENITVKNMAIKIGIWCHEKLVPCTVTVNGDVKKKLRYDLITKELNAIFNRSKKYGFDLKLYSMADSNPAPEYQGVIIVYRTGDFN